MPRNRIERKSSKCWRGTLRGITAALVYNLSCFTHGCSTGWVSGVLGNEALTGGAWLAALPCLVALPAAPMFAVLADVRGRKTGAFCIGLIFIISWCLAAWCGGRGIWAARVAAGAGGAGALALAPLYCAEIAPRTRGLAALPALACSCGILFAYTGGGLLSAHALSLVMAVPPVLLLISLLWLPETPSFLINTGKIQKAAKVMCWFNGSDFTEDLTDVIEQQEVRIRTSGSYSRHDLGRDESDTFQPMLKRNSGLESNSEKRSEKREQTTCRELFRGSNARRALISCLVLIAVAAGSGAGAVNSFAAAVLRHSTHRIPKLNVTAYNFTIYNGTLPRDLFESSEAGSMLCGTALVLGAAVACGSVDRVGRKTLLLWSCSGIAFCLAVLGVYCDPHLNSITHKLLSYKKIVKDKTIKDRIYFENITSYNDSIKYNETKPWHRLSSDNISYVVEWPVKIDQSDADDVTIWLPVILLSMVLFFYNIGLGSVPYVLVTELFSINVSTFILIKIIDHFRAYYSNIFTFYLMPGSQAQSN
ncbi:probable metabolite transport protein CsbC [Leptidea sinapis]|uniref:probable metabolite transport protein CsbC n=1 Tax=Leptidea sinapis TaxID=189913 RepID=UPI0021C4211D|nr:probable metabolite transport protein CsbC [Leptidea sinapis]